MQRFNIEISTEGNGDIVNLSGPVNARLKEIGGDGLIHLFAVGSTLGLTTLEFEPGLVKHDLPSMMQRLIPDDMRYQHEATWHDDNGHSHLRAALFGPQITVPFAKGKMLCGEYQQVVLIDMDTRPRRRTIIATVIV